MQREVIQALQRQALRLVATPADAQDLVQETLLAGLCAGRSDAAFLHGVLRKQAAMAWRSTGRRLARESMADDIAPSSGPEDACEAALASGLAAWILGRPRALRQLAVLALHGLDPVEIRWLLDLAPAAFRQRVAALRSAVAAAPADLRASLHVLAQRPGAWRATVPEIVSRRALKAALARKPGLATHDPDGHALAIRGLPHVSASRGN
jgi:DNA-directed RNA polymerase specialized sigma24 family protein